MRIRNPVQNGNIAASNSVSRQVSGDRAIASAIG